MAEGTRVAVPVSSPMVAAGNQPRSAAGQGQRLEIVPLAGLPVVGLALVGLVASSASNRMWGVDFFHVVAGGLWTGIDLFLGFVIGPVLGHLSVPARAELSKRFMPKMVIIMPTLVVCTLAAGWQLASHEGNLSAVCPEDSCVVASMVVVVMRLTNVSSPFGPA